MPTIVIDQAEVRLTLEQLIAALRQLPEAERARVRRELEPASWEEHLDALLARVRGRVQLAPVRDEDIDAQVESVRAHLHNQSQH